MHPLYWVFLSVFVIEKIIEILLDRINVRYINKQGTSVPPAFTGILDTSLYKKSQAYTRDKARFSLINGMVDSVVVLLFLYGGLLDLYNSWIIGLTGSFILQGLLFFLILTTALHFLHIPFSLYSHFRLEKKYGFNTMTPVTWLGDFFKGLLVQSVLLTALFSGALAIYQASPEWWWLWLWLFFFAFILFTMFISPYVIEPLFNKFHELEDPALDRDIKNMMQKAGIEITRIQVMDASRRSKHSNAYFTGIGRVKRIVFYDTLIEQMDHDEILAVLAHEAGHWKRKHILKRIVTTKTVSLLLFYLVFRIIENGWLNKIYPIETVTLFSSLIILSFVLPLIQFWLTPLASMRSRKQEREADDFAVKYAKEPQAMTGALKKLAMENLSNLTPHPVYARWFYSHPPVIERIEYLERRLKDGV